MLKAKLSRRDFLRMATLAGAGLAVTLAGCKPKAAEESTTGAGGEPEGDLRVLILQGPPVEPVNEFLATATTAKYPKPVFDSTMRSRICRSAG